MLAGLLKKVAKAASKGAQDQRQVQHVMLFVRTLR